MEMNEEDAIRELRAEVRDTEEVLKDIEQTQAPLSYGGFLAVIEQVERMKIQLARMEAQLWKQIHRSVTMN